MFLFVFLLFLFLLVLLLLLFLLILFLILPIPEARADLSDAYRPLHRTPVRQHHTFGRLVRWHRAPLV
jgi:hypothetical protein